MNDRITSATCVDCETLAVIAIVTAAATRIRGHELLTKGYENDDPVLRKEGVRLLLTGGSLTAFASMFLDGTLPEKYFLEFLDGWMAREQRTYMGYQARQLTEYQAE